jgi:hypothetical protein
VGALELASSVTRIDVSRPNAAPDVRPAEPVTSARPRLSKLSGVVGLKVAVLEVIGFLSL